MDEQSWELQNVTFTWEIVSNASAFDTKLKIINNIKLLNLMMCHCTIIYKRNIEIILITTMILNINVPEMQRSSIKYWTISLPEIEWISFVCRATSRLEVKAGDSHWSIAFWYRSSYATVEKFETDFAK